MQSEQINELATALAKAQAVVKNAAYNKINPHFKSKYADLASVFDAVRKPLADHGLAVMQTMEAKDGGFLLVTTLAHSSGQWIKSHYPLPANGTPQQVGSALTYARRYSLSSIVGIAADEDDDAEGAERSKTNGGPISHEQAETLLAAMNEAGADQDKFCAAYKIPDLRELPAAKYQEAMSKLEQKRASQARATRQ